MTSVGVEDGPMPLIWANAPFHIHVGISDKLSLCSLPFVFSVAFVVLLLIFVCLQVVDAQRQVYFESPLSHNLLEHAGEVERVWIKDPLLCCME